MRGCLCCIYNMHTLNVHNRNLRCYFSYFFTLLPISFPIFSFSIESSRRKRRIIRPIIEATCQGSSFFPEKIIRLTSSRLFIWNTLFFALLTLFVSFMLRDGVSCFFFFSPRIFRDCTARILRYHSFVRTLFFYYSNLSTT